MLGLIDSEIFNQHPKIKSALSALVVIYNRDQLMATSVVSRNIKSRLQYIYETRKGFEEASGIGHETKENRWQEPFLSRMLKTASQRGRREAGD